MGQNSACEQDRDFAQGQVFTRFDKFHQREQEEKRAMGQLRHVSSTSGLESASTLSKKQRKSIHGTKSISNPSSPLGAKTYSQSLGFPSSHQPFDHYHSVNILINATNNTDGQSGSPSSSSKTSNNSTIIMSGGGNNCESPHLLSPATQSAGSAAASSRRRGQSAASPQSNYFVNNTHQTQLMINQDAIEVKKRIHEDSDDEEEDPATVRRSRRKSFSLFKNDKKVDMF